MKISIVKQLVLSLTLATGISAVSTAYAHDVANAGYLNDTRGNVVKNNYDQCWRTGYWTPAMATAECDPDLVAKKEEPKKEAPKAVVPAPVAGPAAPAVKVTFKAETLFDFDKAVVRAEGKKELDDKVVANMKEHPEVELLLVTGHADRLGSDKYNQKLSERRAVAVKDYLASQGVAADRVKAVGKGESEPNADADTVSKCKGNKKTKKLIECLQPDRRVTVEPEIQVPTK
ncbi:OmpA/MotB domain-containing protein [Sulfuricella denitrificans skB26]|uniref:OmpA/MotB domain-containing protein n=1 Tax=Sulfuricella denitrificans (strain DSM 22764 / NBRC 105220 / skB26) TaxID=1163617 RepID=S6AJW7_SULDS|nr:OmpA family protein [Sulfuricella denitrificans]BAN34864.1 OmpA/MotB domain-containing protein [Sulfuricella denitrificans skB26]